MSAKEAAIQTVATATTNFYHIMQKELEGKRKKDFI
jgi:hypothetical protein